MVSAANSTMTCIDCHYLCALTGENLPLRQRGQLRGRDPEAFTWLACGTAIDEIAHVQPQVFDQVLQGRRCRGHVRLDPSLTVEQMKARDAKRMPAWFKVAAAVTLLVGLAAATGAILQAVS